MRATLLNISRVIIWSGLVMLLSPIATAQHTDPIYACEYTGDAGLAPGTFNKWKCECGGGVNGARNETCEPVCDAPKRPEDDAAFRRELRCLFNRSPSAGDGTGESAAWAVKTECGFALLDERRSPTAAEVKQSCPAKDQTNILWNFHTHPYEQILKVNAADRGHRVRTDVQPSPGDREAARECNRPFYVLSDNWVFVAYPDGKTEDVTKRFPGWKNSCPALDGGVK